MSLSKQLLTRGLWQLALFWACLATENGGLGAELSVTDELGKVQQVGPSISQQETNAVPYVRLKRMESNRTALQVAAREFIAPAPLSTRIILIGVIHIGTPEYFKELQALLDAQQVVLFEGIGARDKSDLQLPEDDGSLQILLAQAADLVFQLQAIDYNRDHFHNSDLTVSELFALLDLEEDNPQNSVDEGVLSTADEAQVEFQQLLGILDGSHWVGRVLGVGARWIRQNPRMQTATRLLLVELMGRLEGQIPDSPVLPDGIREVMRVLIQERNRKVHEDTLAWLGKESAPESLAIFYGAGHMPDLERLLRNSPGVRAGRTQWFTAFDVDPDAAGLSASQQALIRGLVDRQVQALLGKSP